VELLSTHLCLLRDKAQEIRNHLKSAAFLNVFGFVWSVLHVQTLCTSESGMAGGQAAQGEPSLPLTEVRAAHSCLRPRGLQAPLSLLPKGLFLHLSLTIPEPFLCHLSLSYACSFSFLFIFACSPLARVGNTVFVLKQTCSARKFPKKKQLLNVMTHVMNVMAHGHFWSGMDSPSPGNLGCIHKSKYFMRKQLSD